MEKNCFEKVCIFLFLVIFAVFIAPFIAITSFSILVAVSICACQICCCFMCISILEPSWIDKWNQHSIQRFNQLSPSDYLQRPSTPPPTYSRENVRSRVIPDYYQPIYPSI